MKTKKEKTEKTKIKTKKSDDLFFLKSKTVLLIHMFNPIF